MAKCHHISIGNFSYNSIRKFTSPIFHTHIHSSIANDIAFESIPEVATIIFSSNFMFDPDTEVSRLGLHGLWQTEDNRQAGTILVGLGRITEEAFQRAIEERDKAVKSKETMHGCAICGGLFPESKCVKAKMNQSEGWVCITDFERLEAEL